MHLVLARPVSQQPTTMVAWLLCSLDREATMPPDSFCHVDDVVIEYESQRIGKSGLYI